MRSLLLLALTPAAFAVVDGTVTNETSGKPQPGATVTLYRLSQSGLESIESVKSGADGKFSINQSPQGPHLIQTAYDGVTYNHMLPPPAPKTGLALSVYNSSAKPGEAKVTQRFVLFEPDGQTLKVTESFVFNNDGKTTYNDPENGAVRFHLHPAATKTIQINATAPQGMPIRRALEKTPQKDIYKVDFPIKPGASDIQLNYSIPFTTPGTFESRAIYPGDAPVSLIAPVGVKIKGDGLESSRQEPRSQATIFMVRRASFKVEIDGKGTLRIPQEAEGDGGGAGPGISQIMPRVYSKRYWVLGLAAAILVLGFVLLVRSRSAA